MKKLLLAIIPLLGACATHAPMSEMVMFNKSFEQDTLKNQDQAGVTIFDPKPGLDRFEEEKEAKYYYGKFNPPNINIYGASFYSDRFGISGSLGKSLGIDGTVKLISDYFGTVSISAMDNRPELFTNFFIKGIRLPRVRNYHLSIQKPLIVSSLASVSLGGFYQMDTKVSRVFVPAECENICFDKTEYGTVSFRSFGIKSMLLISGNSGSNSSFLVYTRLGKLVNYNEFYFSLGFTFTPYIKKD